MSVLHILPTYGVGGLGSVALNLIREWPEATRHVVVAPQFPGYTEELLPAFAREAGEGNVAWVPRHNYMTPPVWGQEVASTVAGILRGKKVTRAIQYNCLDLVWSQFVLSRLQYQGKVVCHIGTVVPDTKANRGAFASPLNANTTWIPCQSGARARALELGAPAERMREPTWNGVHQAPYETRPRTQAKVFGFAARMCVPEQKDWQTLFQAFRLAHIPGKLLRIAGSGADRPRLERMAEGLPVEFLGHVPPERMPAFFGSLDCFVMASHAYEGLPMVVAEAVASRCLLAGTRAPSLVELANRVGLGDYFSGDPVVLAGVLEGLQKPDTLADNAAKVEALRPMLDAREMAKAYYLAGV